MKIKKSSLIYFLIAYMVGIYVWDYTIIYQTALVLMAAVSLLIYRKKWINLNTWIVCEILFIVFFAIHTLLGFSIRPSLSYDYLLTMVINCIASISIICIIDSRQKIEVVLKAIIVIAVFLCIYAVIADRSNLLSGNLGEGLKKPIIGGNYLHNNIPMLASYAILALSYFKVCKKQVRFSYLLYVFFLVVVFLSGARKALIFAFFGIIIYPIMASEKSSSSLMRFFKLGLVAISGIIILYVLLTNDFLYGLVGYRFSGVISGLMGGEYTESSARSRSIMITTAVNAIRNKWWIGIGLNTFRTLPGSFYTWSHNNYLEILVSGGIIPLCLYYLFPIKATLKLTKYKKDPMASMFFWFLVFMFIHDYLTVSYIERPIGFFINIACAFLLVLEREKDQDTSLANVA